MTPTCRLVANLTVKAVMKAVMYYFDTVYSHHVCTYMTVRNCIVCVWVCGCVSVCLCVCLVVVRGHCLCNGHILGAHQRVVNNSFQKVVYLAY